MFMSFLQYLAPEIWVTSLASLILILDLTLAKTKNFTYLLSQITLMGAMLFTLKLTGFPEVMLFQQMFVVDDIANLLKFFIYLYAIFVFMYSRKYLTEQKIYRGEYFVLGLFSILGMMVLVSSRSFLTLYLGIELLVLPLYALIALAKDRLDAPEAAMKYFVMGAMASGMMLYGISLLYGVTGSFEVGEIADYLLHESSKPQSALLFGLMFVMVGFAFKLGAVPFHMWIPDVYQGSPTSVTLFIGTLPKLAAFGFAIRLFVDTFAEFGPHWEPLLIIMAVLSITLGNIVAIAQKNLKRMLAYSTIAHVGFIVLGLLAGPESGYASAFVYVIIYSLTALGAFGIMIALSHQGFESENIEDFRGLGVRQPWVAFLMMLLLFSLAGVPPLAGFYAKLIVLDAVINAGYTWLAIYAVILTVVGAYYYLRMVKVMFFDEPLDTIPSQLVSPYGKILLSINGLAVLAVGMFPGPIFNLAQVVL